MSRQPEPPRPPAPSPREMVEALQAQLARVGIERIEPGQLVRLVRLASRYPTLFEPANLRERAGGLAGLLGQTPAEVERLHAALLATGAAPTEPPEEESPEPEAPRGHWLWLALPLAFALGVCLWGGLGPDAGPADGGAPVGLELGTDARASKPSADARLGDGGAVQGDLDANVAPNDQVAEPSTSFVEPSLVPVASGSAHWLYSWTWGSPGWVAIWALGVLALIAGWLLFRWTRGQVQQQRAEVEARQRRRAEADAAVEDAEWDFGPLKLPEAEVWSVPPEGIEQAATWLQGLFGREPGHRFDWAATAFATAAKAGFLTPIAALERGSQPLVVLSQQYPNEGHAWLGAYRAVVDGWRNSGIEIEHLCFGEDPNALEVVESTWLPQGYRIGLRELSAIMGDGPLVLLAHALSTLGYVGDKGVDTASPWAELLRAWTRRVWLDPDPRIADARPDRIDLRGDKLLLERIERSGLRRYPLTKEGLRAAAEAFLVGDGPPVPFPGLPDSNRREVKAALDAWATAASLVPDSDWDLLEVLRQMLPEVRSVFTQRGHVLHLALHLLAEAGAKSHGADVVRGPGVLVDRALNRDRLVKRRKAEGASASTEPHHLERRVRTRLLDNLRTQIDSLEARCTTELDRLRAAPALNRMYLKRARHRYYLASLSGDRDEQVTQCKAMIALGAEAGGREAWADLLDILHVEQAVAGRVQSEIRHFAEQVGRSAALDALDAPEHAGRALSAAEAEVALPTMSWTWWAALAGALLAGLGLGTWLERDAVRLPVDAAPGLLAASTWARDPARQPDPIVRLVLPPDAGPRDESLPDAAAVDSGDGDAEVADAAPVTVDATTPLPPAALASTPSRPSMLPIYAGAFTMGSPENEGGRFDDENQQRVLLEQDFWLAETEVTQGQWRALMGNNPSQYQACGDECPVERVSWFDALAYCNQLSKAEGQPECYQLEGCSGVPGTEGYQCASVALKDGLSCRGYRLPTEPEWEYAARAGDLRATYNGNLTLDSDNNAPALEAIAWYRGSSADEQQGSRPVRKKRPNTWGLHDMLGNVSEWTQDVNKGDLQIYGKVYDMNADISRARVFRGCGWSFDARYCRAAIRGDYPPGYRRGALGFRPARSRFP